MNLHKLTKEEKLDLMGKKCLFSKYLLANYQQQRYRKIKSHIKIHEGWVCGFGFLYEGTLATEVNNSKLYNYFIHRKTIPYIKIVINTLGTIYKVPLDSYRIIRKVKR